MRILVVDRAIKQEALQGLRLLPVMTLAREGQVRGLLLRFRPDDRANVQVTLLYPPGSLPAWAPLPSRMERGVIKDLEIGNNRVVGAIEDPTRQSHRRDMPPITYAVTFGAPIFHEPKVTQDLKGQAARTSPQLEAIRTSTDSVLATSVDAVQRIVVRGNRAVAIFRDKSWRTLERIGAEWTVAE